MTFFRRMPIPLLLVIIALLLLQLTVIVGVIVAPENPIWAPLAMFGTVFVFMVTFIYILFDIFNKRRQ